MATPSAGRRRGSSRRTPGEVVRAMPAASTVRGMFNSIVVGTNGTETADKAVGRAVELAKLPGRRCTWSARTSRRRPTWAAAGPPAEAAEWAISPHFKVDAVLDRATDIAHGGGVELEVHGPKGRCGLRDPHGGRAVRRRPDRARQQGHAGGAPRARQRAEHGVPPGVVRRSRSAGGSPVGSMARPSERPRRPSSKARRLPGRLHVHARAPRTARPPPPAGAAALALRERAVRRARRAARARRGRGTSASTAPA